MEYFVWKSDIVEGYCVLGALAGVEKAWQINHGTSRLEGFPDDASFTMRPDFPKDIQVADNVSAPVFTVVSKKLREALEPATTNRLEFLPVKILNHKGRVASAEHFILNPLDVCDCIDIDRSEVIWNKINKKLIAFCKALVIRDQGLPADATIFRPKHWERLILVRGDLAEKLRGAGLTGLAFGNAADFKG